MGLDADDDDPRLDHEEHVHDARAAVQRKGQGPVVGAVRLEQLDEGLSVPTLHIGSYDDEAPVLEAMHHELIPAEGLTS